MKLLFAFLPLLLQAEQFVLFDQTFTFAKEDADNSTRVSRTIT
jgi:hypothetical protein